MARTKLWVLDGEELAIYSSGNSLKSTLTTNGSGNLVITPGVSPTNIIGDLNISGLTASQVVTTNGSKTLVSSASLATTLGGTGLTSYVLGDTIYASGTNTLSKLTGNTTTARKFLTQTGDGVNSAAPAWFDLFATANTWTANQTISAGTTSKLDITNGTATITNQVNASNQGVYGTTSNHSLFLVTNNSTFMSVNGSGTINLPNFTSGSVLYIDSSKNLTEANSTFFWNSANNALMVGTNSYPGSGRIVCTGGTNGTALYATTSGATSCTGLFANATGTSTENRGVSISCTGAATTNYGIIIDSNSGTANYAIYVNSGDCFFGQSSGKIGFFGTAPVIRPLAGYTQTYSTSTKTNSNPAAATITSTASTQTTPWGYSTQAQADAIVAAINFLITDVANAKQLINAIIDDLQGYGLVQ